MLTDAIHFAANDFQDALLKAQVVDKVLKIGVTPPWNRYIKEIYVRVAYENILRIMECNPDRDYLVVGNPGVGKSLFAIYVLYCALRKSQSVLFHVAVHKEIYFFQADQKASIVYSGDQFLAEKLNTEGVLYLYDAATRCHPFLPTGKARVIAFSCPSRKNTADLVKLRYVSLHMPTWSEEELLSASKLDQYGSIDAETVHSLFHMFGGIARYVLEVDEAQRKSYIATLRTNVSSCTVSMINVAMEADIDKYSHMIIHQRTSDYENYELHFASQYVRTAVVDSLQANDRTRMPF